CFTCLLRVKPMTRRSSAKTNVAFALAPKPDFGRRRRPSATRSSPWARSRLRSRYRTSGECSLGDEPGARACFSYKMSLKGRSVMLGFDHQHGSSRAIEPGANPGVFGGQRCSGVSRPKSGRGVPLGKPDVVAAEVPGVETAQPWAGATLPGEDDGV